MTEHQKPQAHAVVAQDDGAKTKTEKATAALAGAVAKRTEARKRSDKSGGKASHGGKPISTVKVSDQIRGK